MDGSGKEIYLVMTKKDFGHDKNLYTSTMPAFNDKLNFR